MSGADFTLSSSGILLTRLIVLRFIKHSDDAHILRKLHPGDVWYLTFLGSLATTQREYIALHAFRHLNMQVLNKFLLRR